MLLKVPVIRALLLSLLAGLCSGSLCGSRAFAAAEVVPGVARFEAYAGALSGKRVGLVVNQASLFRGQHTIDFLLSRARENNFQVVRLFALEHGVRGEGGAGEEIKDGFDPVSGLPVVSLYGPKKKPSAADLAGLDVVVYDIQDVGVRFFTYISSLGLIMEACAEAGVGVLVLDRPNPNDYVEGPVLDMALKSFVGAFPIPVVYGLSAGELARMIKGERWQAGVAGLDLKVVRVSGWKRGELVTLEARPSPGLRTAQAVRAYPSIALFEATSVSFGRFTDAPFTQYGVPAARGGARLGTHRFTPADGPFKGQECRGESFGGLEPGRVPLFTTDIFARALRVLGPRMVERESFLRLLVGDRAVVRGMLAGKSYEELSRGFATGVARYQELRKKYLLY